MAFRNFAAFQVILKRAFVNSPGSKVSGYMNMKMQKRILLVLVIIIIGISILSGLKASKDSMLQANEFGVVHEAMTIVSRAQAWYRKPKWLGGGSGSFSSFTLQSINYDSVSVNARFFLSEQQNQSFRLSGIGKEGEPPLRVTIEVFPDSISSILITQ